MKRRQFLKGSVAAASTLAFGKLAAPAVAQDAAARTIRFVPQTNLNNPDPVFASSPVERQHGYMVWDSLYGIDSNLAPQPQMCSGHTVSSDGLTWRFTLRDGLIFHDNEAVRGVDCVASIRRWGRRNSFGQRLMSQLDEMSAPSDKTFEIRLKRPFPLMTYALGAEDCFIMPERIARTDAFQQIKEFVGSGPFKFSPADWVSGSRVLYTKFEKYLPRSEKADALAGGKVVHVDRVEWRIIVDPATAAGALQKGEIDWIEEPLTDLLPVLRKASGVRVVRQDPFGAIGTIQFNHLHPPFDNVLLRRAILPAINQRDYLDAVIGDEKELRANGTLGIFTLGTPLANQAGLEALSGPRSIDKAKQMVAQSGYKGEPIVMMAVSDIPTVNAMSLVTLDVFQKIGLNVKYESMDRGTLGARRAKMDPPDKGGWNCFANGWLGLLQSNPGTHNALRANGREAWFGWPTSPQIESLRGEWFDAPDLATQKQLAEKLQVAALENVNYIPVCQWYRATAMRTNITDALDGHNKVFWNVRKA